MAKSYRMTPKRAAALKKAQIASAKKRKGTGKGRPVPKKRRAVAKAPVARRKVVRRAGKVAAPRSKAQINRRKVIRRAGAVAAVGLAVGGAAYTYKNRERLIVQPVAQRRFVKIAEREKGRKLTKREKIAVKNREKREHSRRSVGVARAYKNARDLALLAAKDGKSLNPRSKHYLFKGQTLKHIDDGVKRNGKYGTDSGRFIFELYRKDVNARAESRLNKMKGRKQDFGYKSGKQKRVSEKGVVKRLFW